MEDKARTNDRDPETRTRDEEGKTGKTVGPTGPVEDADDPALEQMLRQKPPLKDRTRGGTGIGRDLDH